MAKGYTHRHDITYDETFVSVAKMMTVRVFLAITVAKGHQMDVKNAFM